jgi:hypothetical protein
MVAPAMTWCHDDLCIVVMTMYCFDDYVLLNCCDEKGLSWPMSKLVLLFAEYIMCPVLEAPYPKR